MCVDQIEQREPVALEHVHPCVSQSRRLGLGQPSLDHRGAQQRGKELRIVVPLTLFLIFLLLYFNFGNFLAPAVVMLSVPFALIGGVWLVYGYGFNLSVAVAVGFIALAGLAVETGVLVLTFVDQALNEARGAKQAAWGAVDASPVRLTGDEITKAVQHGTSRRVRPVAMTASSTIIGLLPIMLNSGTGSDVMQRIAAPMVGGMLTTTLLCLLVLPVIYGLLVNFRERRVSGNFDVGDVEK